VYVCIQLRDSIDQSFEQLITFSNAINKLCGGLASWLDRCQPG